jgi:hypothetical protein
MMYQKLKTEGEARATILKVEASKERNPLLGTPAAWWRRCRITRSEPGVELHILLARRILESGCPYLQTSLFKPSLPQDELVTVDDYEEEGADAVYRHNLLADDSGR